MAEQIPDKVLNVPTPCFLVDLDKLTRNAKVMQSRCDKLGVQLRPHTKTHKTVEAADILSAGRRRCVTVSTLAEAELYAESGYDDILYAFPITTNKIARCRKLNDKLGAFHVMLDSKAGYQALESSGTKKLWSVYLEIDVMYNRTGVSWKSDDVVELATLISGSDVMTFRGLYCHNGDTYHNKGGEEIRTSGKESTAVLMEVKQSGYMFPKRKESENAIRTITCFCIMAFLAVLFVWGSTPSCSHPDDSMSSLEEFSPGNYVFYDLMQKDIGSCKMEDIAGRVATRIIGHKIDLNILIIDCGFLALSKDGMENNLPNGPWIIQDNPNLRLVGMSQELGKVTAIEGEINFASHPIGSMMFIYPYHSCATAAMHSVYFVHSGDSITSVWRPTRGW
ncbi:D-threo-3-hydroxyaspartate dehydratase-like [Pecten maximus]|uniref:D-threo-3-hydroxyaspartate dehydratase-like n=1 Tax=Pecten maximus TaxID=6579 RepID=UPI001458CC5D|nr:D-threo-3-hydroxyaspartate dehydratase-like [Pecten maximus]